MVSPELDCSEYEAKLDEKRMDEKVFKDKLESKPTIDLSQFGFTILDNDEFFKEDPHGELALSENDRHAQEVFDPLNVDKSVAWVKANPKLIATLTKCQLDYVLRWKQVILALEKDTMYEILMSEAIASRIEADIPHATFATLLQNRQDYIELVNGTFPGQEYLKSLLTLESFIQLLSVEFLANMLEHKNVQNWLTDKTIIIAMNAYPDLIQHLRSHGLKLIRAKLTDPVFYTLLTRDQIANFLEYPDISQILTEEAFIAAISIHPDLPVRLGPQGLEFVRNLMHSRTFVKALDKEDLARFIMYPNIQTVLTKESLFIALNAHPDLPAKLSPQALDFGSKFLVDQDFLTALPCAVYKNAASNSSFVNALEPQVLQAFSKNEHFWTCLPREMVEHMMKTTQLGGKLDITDILRAALTMSKATRTSPSVILPIFEIQFPQVISKLESDYYDWFNGLKLEKRKWFEKYNFF